MKLKDCSTAQEKKDQWDWFVVWEQLGLPELERLRRIVDDLVVLRRAVLNNDLREFRNTQKRLQYLGTITSLKYFLGLENQYMEKGTGVLYMLGTREMRGLLKIGFTQRNVTYRANEINTATGVVIPFGVIHIWRVRNPKKVEQEVHALLADYRVRSDREFFNMEYNKAIHMVTKFLDETRSLSKRQGIVKQLLIEKGYGFLSSEGQDFFFHNKEVKDIFSELKAGDAVEFIQLDTSLGYAASSVQRIT